MTKIDKLVSQESESSGDFDFHRWDLSPQEAIQVQESLRSRVITSPLEDTSIRFVAGVDVGLPRGAKHVRGAVAVLTFENLDLVEQSTIEMPVHFPYVPGLLSFREMPAVLAALEKLHTTPDVFIVDGHGYAHPRRFGLACHLGTWLNKPAIGCGKSILVGEQAPLGNSRGSVACLQDKDEMIGVALRTRENVKPIYVSVGNQVDLSSAIRIVLKCTRSVRLPEPIRWAHHFASNKQAG
jgi:deoxyribonuclease V